MEPQGSQENPKPAPQGVWPPWPAGYGAEDEAAPSQAATGQTVPPPLHSARMAGAARLPGPGPQLTPAPKPTEPRARSLPGSRRGHGHGAPGPRPARERAFPGLPAPWECVPTCPANSAKWTGPPTAGSSREGSRRQALTFARMRPAAGDVAPAHGPGTRAWPSQGTQGLQPRRPGPQREEITSPSPRETDLCQAARGAEAPRLASGIAGPRLPARSPQRNLRPTREDGRHTVPDCKGQSLPGCLLWPHQLRARGDSASVAGPGGGWGAASLAGALLRAPVERPPPLAPFLRRPAARRALRRGTAVPHRCTLKPALGATDFAINGRRPQDSA